MPLILTADADPGIAAWATSGAAGAIENTLTVSPTVGDAQYTTIAAAIAASVLGDTILVYPGTYTESNPLTMAAGTTLIAVGGQEVTTMVCANAGAHGIIMADDTRVAGLSMKDASGAGSAGFNVPVGVDRVTFFATRIIDCDIGWLSESADGTAVNQSYLRTGTVTSASKCSGIGRMTVTDLLLNESSMVTHAFHADGAATRLTIVGGAVYGDSGGSCVNGMYAENDGVIDVTGCRLQSCTNGINIAATNGSIDGSGFTVEGSLTWDVLISGGAGSSLRMSSGSLDSTKISQGAGSTLRALFTDLSAGDQGVTVLGELHVGSPTLPAESSLGEGDSNYRDMVVLTDDGTATAFADITSALTAGTAQALLAGTAVGQRVLIGNTSRKFPGFRDAVSTAVVLGGGALQVGLSTAPATFTTVPVMTADADEPHGQHGSQILQRAQASNVRWDPGAVTWTQETYNGTTAYWCEIRVITGAISTAPILTGATADAPSLKLHTNQTKINGNGLVEFFGGAIRTRPIPLPGQRILTGSTPNSISIAFTTNISRTGERNQYRQSQSDGVAYALSIEEGMDTSRPLIVRTLWTPTDGSAGNVALEVDYRVVTTGDVLDGTLTDTGLVQTVASSAVTNALQPEVLHEIDASSAVPGDVLVFSHFRNAGVGTDTYSNNVNIVERTMIGSYWHN